MSLFNTRHIDHDNYKGMRASTYVEIAKQEKLLDENKEPSNLFPCLIALIILQLLYSSVIAIMLTIF